MQIAVIGSSAPEKYQEDLAYALGKAIARAGATVVCGGRSGVMHAVCKGAKEEKGLTIGILPSVDGNEANEFVDIQVRTGLGWARNSIVANSGDVVIAVGGSHGTLSEMSYASQHGRKIIALKGSGGWADELAGKSLTFNDHDKVLIAETPEEAVKLALENSKK